MGLAKSPEICYKTAEISGFCVPLNSMWSDTIPRNVWGKVWGNLECGAMGKLTATKVRALNEPGRYSDGDGLFLELNGKESGRWLLRVQSGGRRRDIGLGSLKAVSLADAREAALLIRKKIAQGIDPVAERKQERRVIPTFRKAAEMVHEEHQKAWKNGKHQDQWIATLKTYAFPKMGDRLVSEIEGPLIRDVLGGIDIQDFQTS